MRTTAIVLLATLSLSVSAAARAEPVAGPWEFVRNKDGIVVHRRKVGQSSLHEFRGRGTVFAPVSRVVAVVQDTRRRVEWINRCVDSATIEQPTERSEIAYTRTKGNLAISDRDAVLAGRALFDGRQKLIRLEFISTQHPSMPPRKGVVRMPYLKGHWVVKPSPRDPNWTEVEYQVHADPGGWLPKWAVNMVSKELPYKTIMGLRKQVMRRHYPALEEKIVKLPEYRQLFE